MTPEERRAKNAARMRKWRAENKEHLDAYNAERRADPERRKAAAEYARQWRRDNPEKVKARNVRWREWFDAEASRDASRRRRALQAEATIERFTEADVLVRHGNCCYLCTEPIDLLLPRTDAFGLHLDHVTPLFKGGEHSLDNVRPTHGVCNLRKNDAIWLGPTWFGYL